MILLHPLGMSPRVWADVIPLLPFEAVALPLLGHRGGAAPTRRPVRVRDLVDDAERQLDARGIDRADIAGNSIGGWVALELARRGRARSVTAISPAGTWTAGTREQSDSVRKIKRSIRLAYLPTGPLLRSPTIRRLVLRDVAAHGERQTATQVREATRDLLACTVAHDLLTPDEELAPLDFPVTLLWAAEDKLLPPQINGTIARARLPHARWELLPGTGHVPMLDDPALVARRLSLHNTPKGCCSS